MQPVVSLLLTVVALLNGAERYRASEPHMGTLVTITLYADSPEQAQRGFVAAFDRIRAIDAILSDYKPESELSRACSLPAPVSPDLETVLVHAQRVAASTGGAFDITAGPLTLLWREARKQKKLPDQAALADALRRTGYRKLSIANGRVRCGVDGMKLDAGGIGKGYAADEALKAMTHAGITSALVAISGDIAASSAPPGQTGWRIEVQDRIIEIFSAAVSTSGDEFQFLEIDRVRYSHVIDPRTGMPVRNSKPVSVIAGTGIEADSLSTAYAVSGAPEPIIDLRR